MKKVVSLGVAVLVVITLVCVLLYAASTWPSTEESEIQPPRIRAPPGVVTIVEWVPEGSFKVKLVRVIDADTIIVKLPKDKTETVRLVGYDAYEVSREAALRKGIPPEAIEEELRRGIKARVLVERILDEKQLVLKVDSYEPRDKYGRLLGYVWFQVNKAYCPLQKLVLLVYRDEVVRRVLYYPPDEYPYWLWSERITLDLRQVLGVEKIDRVVLHNCTGVYELSSPVITLTRGVYLIYWGNKLVKICDLLSHNTC